jgi:hypothetical protein
MVGIAVGLVGDTEGLVDGVCVGAMLVLNEGCALGVAEGTAGGMKSKKYVG